MKYSIMVAARIVLAGVVVLFQAALFLRAVDGFPGRTTKMAPTVVVHKAGLLGRAWNQTTTVFRHFSPHRLIGSALNGGRKYSRLSPLERLASVPVYYLSSPQGYGYVQADMQAGDPNQKVITYFMSSDDACNYLNEMVQASPQGVNEFRVSTTTLDAIIDKVYAKKQSRKYGRMPVSNLLRIQPSSKQCANAEKIIKSRRSAREMRRYLTSLAIPVFSVPGLFCRRDNNEMVYPYYISCEDLLNDWRAASPKAVNIAKIEVHDLADVLCLAKGITARIGNDFNDHRRNSTKSSWFLSASKLVSPWKWVSGHQQSNEEDEFTAALKVPAVVPPSKEIDWLRKFYRNELEFKNEYQISRMYPMPKEQRQGE